MESNNWTPEKVKTLKKNLLTALRECKGNKTRAAKMCGVGRTWLWKATKEDHKFGKEVESIKEEEIDHVESKLLEHIDKGNLTAIIFYLKTIGATRGYVEKKNFVVEDNRAVPEEDLTLLTVEELRKLQSLKEKALKRPKPKNVKTA